MTDYSFNIKKSEGFFLKLLEEYDDFIKSKTSSRFALNCAMNAWHLVDWVYYEFNYSSKVGFTKLSDFQDSLKILCPSLQIMQDLTIGIKHHTLESHEKRAIVDETHQRKVFSSGFSNGFSKKAFVIVMKDGTTRYFEDEIKIVIDFWTKYLEDKHGIIIVSNPK